MYLVTEYLSGGTLDETLKNKSMHTGDLIQSVIRDLLSGLAYLDEKHIMHRDIKPENVILREEDKRWVIGDFGLAAHSDQEYIYDKCGTMGYIAPEIMELNENEKYKQACDTYSLGVIAYQLIVGELPFRVEAENFFDKKIVWVLFDREECKKIHPSVLEFLKNLLDKNPETRITPKEALKSPFFTNKEVVGELIAFHEKKRQDRYDRILKMANHN